MKVWIPARSLPERQNMLGVTRKAINKRLRTTSNFDQLLEVLKTVVEGTALGQS
jgi:hypothetical protein